MATSTRAVTAVVTSAKHTAGAYVEKGESAVISSVAVVEGLLTASIKASFRVVRETVEGVTTAAGATVGVHVRGVVRRVQDLASGTKGQVVAGEAALIQGMCVPVRWAIDHPSWAWPGVVGLGVGLSPVTRGAVLRWLLGPLRSPAQLSQAARREVELMGERSKGHRAAAEDVVGKVKGVVGEYGRAARRLKSVGRDLRELDVALAKELEANAAVGIKIDHLPQCDTVPRAELRAVAKENRASLATTRAHVRAALRELAAG